MTGETQDEYGDKAKLEYKTIRASHWDSVSKTLTDPSRRWSAYYHRRLTEVYQFHVHPGQKVLELGCGNGDLLAALEPSRGVGVDLSQGMVDIARQRHPDLEFIEADVHELTLDEKFDVIILSDVVNDLWDVQAVFERIKSFTTAKTRVIINFHSHLWEAPLTAVQKLGMANPVLQQNWFTPNDILNMLALTGFETVRSNSEFLWPFGTPLISGFFNKILVRLWPFSHAALTNFVVARPFAQPEQNRKVSVLVPARNEAGNIAGIVARTPQMGAGTEIVFVEGHSRDNTYETIEKIIAENPDKEMKLLRQPGVGKGDAVRAGFAESSGDILMILDADITVPPEDLPRFYDAIVSGKAEFVNGARLVYPMEKEAMRFLNLLGNKFFSMAFSWLLGQPIKDTLCGTKVLWKKDYDKIAANRSYFGDFDPFGDFDLIFGAAKLNMKIMDIPIRYRERVYGDTNISRFSHGWLLLKMVAFALRRIKFI